MAGARPAAPQRPARPLAHVDARMILGLPDDPANLEWLREAVAALQAQDPRPDVDLGSVEQRLAALEQRGWVPPHVAAEIWDAMGAVVRRVAQLEDFCASLDLTPPAPVVVTDPLDPAGWQDVAAAQAALTVLITREAARRSGSTVELYEEMVELDAKQRAGLTSVDEDLLLLQHQGWARERQLVELARLGHAKAIRGLTSLPAAVRYDWQAGWPEVDHVKPAAPGGAPA